MSESESPQVRRDRVTSVAATALVCLAAPTVAILVYNVPGDNAGRRWPLIALAIGAAVGAVIPFLFWAPYRSLGLVVYSSLGWLIAAIYSVCTGHWPGWAHGLALGLIVGGLTRARRGPEPVEDNYRLITAVLFGAGIAWAFVIRERPFHAAGYFVLIFALGLFFWACVRLFRPLFEITLEPAMWLRYAVRGRGPGLTDFPRTGPCIIVANHACWLDPLFLAKVLPRPITPMMTAKFFDQPVIRRIVVAFGVIRVPEKAVKKNTPEIQDAIAALDRGECVVIFPEGYLRRSEERMLRRFGQGIWQILQARPNTPIYACWLEGAWGSYMSYFNGPPTKNKKKDFRRPIGIGVSAATTVPAEVLSEHLPTRIHLMNLVIQARAHLDLPALPPFELPAKEEEESSTTEDTESTEKNKSREKD
jgi:1-acyl-sn-glycerol-3-phosphate acyltransferase